MPSPKDPSSVVQPGPGNAPDGTVSASALNFNPAESSSAALLGHITNPTGAHEDSAISTGAFSAGSRWTDAAGSVESALTVAFKGLNARAAVICDANPAATDADYVGLTAITQAIAASTGHLIEIHCRPGIYNITSTALNNVTIVGGGGFNSASAPEQTKIQNTGGAINIGSCNILRNVLISASGNLNVTGNGTTGYNTFENVSLDIGGSVSVACQYNRFSQFGASPTSVNPLYLEDTTGRNLFERILVGQLAVSGATGASTFTEVRVSQTPKFAGDLIQVSGTDHVFNGLKGQYVGAVSGHMLNLSGSRNVFNGLKLEGSTATLNGLDLSGSNNVINGLDILSATAVYGVKITGSTNALRTVSLRTLTLSSGGVTFDTASNANSVNGLSYSGVTMTSNGLLLVLGSSNSVSNVYSLSRPANSNTYFDLGGSGNTISGMKADSVPSALVSNVLRVSGDGNRASNLHVNNLSSLTACLVKVQQANNCSVEGVNATNLGVTAGAGFKLVDFALNSINCLVKDVSVSSSANMGTTSGLVTFSGVQDCTLDGLYLNNVATSTAINCPIVKGQTSTNSRCVVRNVVSSSTTYANSTLMIDVDQQFWEGLLVERLNLQDQITGASAVKIRNSGAAAQLQSPPIVVQDCVFSNANVASGHTVWVEDFGGKVLIQRCQVSAGGAGMSPVRVEGSWDVKVLDCHSTATGASAIAGSSQYSGTTFERCTFRGAGGGNSGTQLFNGTGAASSATFPHAPLVIRDCMMILGERNVATAASVTPTVFLGGEGSSLLGALGPMVVDGLIITADAVLSPGWHPGTTLAVACGFDVEHTSQSSFDNITIDLKQTGWNVSGTNCSVFPLQFNTTGAVVEIEGSDPSIPGTSYCKIPFKNLSIRGLTRDGQGPRHVLKAMGCSISGLSIDGMSFGTETSYAAETVLLKHADLSESHLFPTSSMLIGAFAHVKADTSNIQRVTVNNLNQGVVPDSSYVFDLTTSVLRDCRMIINAARLDFVIKVPASTSYIEDNRILMTGGVALTGSVINVASGNNVISGNYISSSAVSVGIDVTGSGNAVKDNRLSYTISTSTVAGIRSSGDYNRILSNYIEKSNALSTGMVQIHLNGGNFCQASDNTVITEFSTVGTQQTAINSSCHMAKITDNTVRNTHATSGSIGITVTGDYSNISGNRIWCAHGTFANASFLNATGSTQTIVANHVENSNGAFAGVISTGASFLPTPVDSYNQRT